MARSMGVKLATEGSEAFSAGGIGLELQINQTNGVIDSYTVIRGGEGYVATTAITIVHPKGTGATATIATVDGSGAVLTVTVDTAGTNYHEQGTLKQPNVIMCTLVYLDWIDATSNLPAPVRLTDSATNIRWYTDETDYTVFDTFQAIGALGSIDTIEEGFEMQSYGIGLRLSGIPAELRQQAFADASFRTAYQNRPAKIYVAFLNTNYEIVGEPILIFAGQMDGCQISIGEEIEMVIGVQSRLINWEIPRGGRFNTHDQQVWFPLDTGFDLIPSLINRELDWGGDGRGNSGNAGSSSGGTRRGGRERGRDARCFAHGTLFRMKDGTLKEIQDIVIGDIMQNGGSVYQTVQGCSIEETWYDVNGVHVTGYHAVCKDGEWMRVEDAGFNLIKGYDICYALINSNHRMVSENEQVFGDFQESGMIT